MPGDHGKYVVARLPLLGAVVKGSNYTTLNDEQMFQLGADGFFSPHEGPVRGFVRMFLLLELQKKRYRWINWTYTLNQVDDREMKITSRP